MTVTFLEVSTFALPTLLMAELCCISHFHHTDCHSFLATVQLWKLGGNADRQMESVYTQRQQFRHPFTPEAGRQYAVELNYRGQGIADPMISWYFATQ